VIKIPEYRSDQGSIGLTVAGVTLDNVSWDSFEGGDNTVEGQTYLPGGQRPQRSLGGTPKRSPITMKRIWSDTLINVYKQLDALAGSAVVTATYTVTRAGIPVAAPITYTGTLGTVTRPNYGSETPEKAFLQIIIDPDGEIS
jgi:hypothetical protein